ncbi:type I restriction endonuclease [Mesonia sp.]|uniref:type I restriction endonuclease n=1 Tax=Mesonia sp. TaxID=1960830 RepID=UPI003F96F21B
MAFNEDSRVKIPAILHLMKLGYSYLSLKNADWDKSTNIFTSIFKERIARINPSLNAHEIDSLYQKVKLSLENVDLGQQFYEMLVERSGDRLIDFEDFDNKYDNTNPEFTQEAFCC